MTIYMLGSLDSSLEPAGPHYQVLYGQVVDVAAKQSWKLALSYNLLTFLASHYTPAHTQSAHCHLPALSHYCTHSGLE